MVLTGMEFPLCTVNGGPLVLLTRFTWNVCRPQSISNLVLGLGSGSCRISEDARPQGADVRSMSDLRPDWLRKDDQLASIPNLLSTEESGWKPKVENRDLDAQSLILLQQPTRLRNSYTFDVADTQ